jgi:hypothetical protein
VDITSIEFFAIDKNLESACKICFMLPSEEWPSLNRFPQKSQFFDVIEELPINFHSHRSRNLGSTSSNTYNIKNHHQISVMELGHLLPRSSLTHPEAPSKVCHDSFCHLGSGVSCHPWTCRSRS